MLIILEIRPDSVTRENIEDFIKVCALPFFSLSFLADEVSIKRTFTILRDLHSFKVLKDLGEEYDSQPLVCFISVSKGILGECGMRGGYMEVVNSTKRRVQSSTNWFSYSSVCSERCGTIDGGSMIHASRRRSQLSPHGQERK